ncbi:5-nucleotidase 2,3-cyclic phosphodiesterase related esterase [Companilactobacillus paralimentarius DSM 13238 = JCM 10415]|uniref:5-nucleotidase 2,3-cyclic phosphodiesterase related esterase n=1 Tax=Companilactobacillus paralimentarius DSM 13238 = JCM 10415 TaxID=1122151 RepID=A0A0R1PPJ6_9LACO|nr:bifunctional UDP-sugar hydrolase/5'-nucleotidase [Companilactobacillus paralimentarius]KAE9563032.1 multifunctional 2',3'-cyclic-nucleotide 2'-phosphodiesterase/5'-nucleotidase/3'-nucleotidase [Companilactobacillus paralimentarius]KRL31842.1 5-nucleotidase 2,3-cyclic phosphodiesterase related esterase [Companilactobacillus paralimentarius DSM 13238 = JCM 10415]QFR69922.1 bifunctional metallophosphatase/5'-nucleotidase [Companilactobacillus paralimentarius]
MEKIQIVHTNDLHSHFENFPRVSRFIEQTRQNSTADDFYLFDIGDAMDRAHPLSEATNGQANIAWMNPLHYDAATIGNNEGLGNSHEELEHLYDHANFPVILGNLYEEKTGKLADFAVQSKIFTTKSRTKIGVIGLTAPFILTYPLLNWDIRLIQDMLPKVLQDVKDCDVIVLLSHLGVSMDRLIASKHPEIDVIIGSHTHHLFPKGEMDNGVLLAAAGKYGQNVGTINLELNQDKHVIKKDAFTTPTSSMKVLDTDAAWIKAQYDKGEELLNQRQVANLPVTLSSDYHADHSIIQEALTAVQEYADAEVAILSSGLFLKDLPKGIITEKNLHDILPHAIHVMRTTMTGDNVWRLVMEMEKNRLYLRTHQQKGMGFRGKIFGELIYRGIKIDDKRNVYINGQELNKNQEYTLALLDHYLFVPYFPSIEVAGKNKIMYPKFLRNVFGEYLGKKYPI